MSCAGYTLERFVTDMRRIVVSAEDEADLLYQLVPLAQQVVAARSWLCAEMFHADPELGFGTSLLHVEADQSLFVVVDSWLPGRGVQPHDHDTWAVVVGVEGSERNLFWQRLDDGHQPGHARLACIGERSIAAGEALVLPRGSIHSVINPGDRTSLSFHIYGRHLNYTARRRFDPERNLELPFLIETR